MENNSQQMKFGDISVIRDILMGQQINDFTEKFDRLEQSLSEKEIALTNKINELEAKIHSTFNATEKDNSARFQAIEILLKDTTDKLNETINKISKEDKAKVGRYLAEIGKKLQEG